MQQMRGTQLELLLRIGVALNHIRNGIELADAVAGFYLGDFVGVRDNFGFERFAVAGIIVDRYSRSFRTMRWLSLGLVERISRAVHHFAGDS